MIVFRNSSGFPCCVRPECFCVSKNVSKDAQALHKSGFTLIEAMLSIALIAIVMTPLMITQGSVVQAVSRASLQLQRIFFAENFFVDAQAQAADKKKFSLDKKIEDPSTAVTFERKQPDAKSSLAKVENVVLDRITASWNEESKKRKEVLLVVHYNKPQSSQ